MYILVVPLKFSTFLRKKQNNLYHFRMPPSANWKIADDGKGVLIEISEGVWVRASPEALAKLRFHVASALMKMKNYV
ncbi:hypothetical protein QR680_015134 [Steinernema hermaphroditum]|uniref:Uncharacterized protein n=1 Tax=Steinernema hermaphroditum TaxID=289476 RepID=A0AA39ICP8_9BILA|nr:hypothetical protein QR680_015134 [Steinernema hermaphroditum]